MASNEDIGTRKLAAIMFTDIRDFSKKMGENEVAAMDLLKVHDAMIRDAVAKYSGTIIKSLGDSFMVDFTSAVNAVKCAIEAQERFWQYNQDKSAFEKLEIRVGIHLGDVITVGNDIYGDGVNIAARIEAIAEPTRICVSADIYNQIKNKLPVRAFAFGSIELKNIAEPVEVFELLLDSIPELSTPSQSARQAPARRKAETISRREEEEAKRVEVTKKKVDEEKQREKKEKQERARVHFVRAEEFFRSGDFAKAEEEIKEIYTIVDVHYDAQMLLLRVEEERTRKDEEDRRRRVIEEKKRKEEERKQRIQDCLQRAIRHVEQDQFAEALAAVQDVYRIDPNNEDAKQLEEQIRQAEQAKAELERLQIVEEQEKALQEQQLNEQQEAQEALARAKAVIAEAQIGGEEKPISKRILYGAIAGGVVVLVVATLLILHLLSKPASIAVLTFTSSSSQSSYVGEALSALVAEEIARDEQLIVISPSSARTIDARGTDLGEVARTFGVRYALVGSVEADTQRVALTARFIEIETQKPLWESAATGDLIGLSDLAGKVSAEIHTALEIEAPPERLQRSTPNAKAYDHYLRGRQLVHQLSLASIEQGLSELQQALQLDSTFGLAYATIAEGNLQLFKRGGERDRARLNQALRAGRLAVSLNPEIASAYQVLSEVYRYTQQLDNAWQAVNKSLSLQPGSAQCYRQLALLSLVDGNRETATEYTNQALRIDPKHYESHFVQGLLHLYNQEYEAASQSFESATSLGAEDSLLTVDYKLKAWTGLDQDKKIVGYCQGLLDRADDPTKVILHYWIGRGYQLGGKIESIGGLDEGIELADKVHSQNPNDAITLAYYALLEARRGKNPEMAVKAIEGAEKIAPNSAQLLYLQARLYAIQKDTKKAIANLAKAVSTEFRFSEILDPDFLSIRGDPEFAATIARRPEGRPDSQR